MKYKNQPPIYNSDTLGQTLQQIQEFVLNADKDTTQIASLTSQIKLTHPQIAESIEKNFLGYPEVGRDNSHPVQDKDKIPKTPEKKQVAYAQFHSQVNNAFCMLGRENELSSLKAALTQNKDTSKQKPKSRAKQLLQSIGRIPNIISVSMSTQIERAKRSKTDYERFR